jgi:CheY-like chemotaxis protein
MPPMVIDILLVEDDPGDVRLAQETLREYKLQNALHVVGDGEAALDYLRQKGRYISAKRPDIVLLDWSLPKIDGIEVLEEMHADPDLCDIPVVILNSTRTDQEILKRFRIPVDCFILKPLTLESFFDAVRCFPQFGVSIVRVAASS